MSNPRLLACCDSSAGGPARNGPARPHPTTASESIGNSTALFQVIDERTVTDLLVEQVEFAVFVGNLARDTRRQIIESYLSPEDAVRYWR